ncbi:acyl carrier protein [Bosea sp. (in: a-proteobacteria)]|jgi:acyl carrier protein|uniref:acyl carrier protein n=1 Tax=Bosea sp. (in: a-proteobacteria) TaxID=1871050 RepID=UPI0035665268
MNAANVNIPDDIAKVLRSHIGDPVADLDRQTKLGEDLGFDSLDTVEMVVQIEELRDIEISDDDLDRVTTIGELVDAIEAATARRDGFTVRSGSQP